MLINNNNCMAFKKKGCHEQCIHPKKNGDLCGIHSRSLNIQRVDTEQCVEDIESNASEVAISIETAEPILATDRTATAPTAPTLVQVNIENIKNNKTSMSETSSSQRPQSLNLDEEIAIKKIQRWYRYFYKKNREELIRKCENDTDITMLPLEDIPKMYFYVIEENGKYFGFDVRAINEMLEDCDDVIKNPYTMQPFSQEAIDNYYLRVNHIKSTGSSVKYQDEVDVSFDRYVITVLSKLERLGYHVRPSVFLDMEFRALKKLYIEMECNWSYRIGLLNSEKIKILRYRTLGDVFTKKENVQRLTPSEKNKQMIRDMLLSDINRLITEGDRIYQEKGALIVLMGLVHVSSEVCDSYPWIAEMVSY